MSSEGEAKRAWVEERAPGAVFFDGPGDMDAAIIGVAAQGPTEPLVAYDETLILEALKEAFLGDNPEIEDLETKLLEAEESAHEWYGYNTAGAYVGEKTPWIIVRIAPEETEQTDDRT